MTFCSSCETWIENIQEHRTSGEHELILEVRELRRQVETLDDDYEEKIGNLEEEKENLELKIKEQELEIKRLEKLGYSAIPIQQRMR